MTPKPPTAIEEPWLEITTRTGLTIQCPAPTDEDLASAVYAMASNPNKALFASKSALTGETYMVSIQDALCIRHYTKRQDTDRHQRALQKASRTSSEDSSAPSLTPRSLSASQTRRSNSLPGVPGSVTLH